MWSGRRLQGLLQAAAGGDGPSHGEEGSGGWLACLQACLLACLLPCCLLRMVRGSRGEWASMVKAAAAACKEAAAAACMKAAAAACKKAAAAAASFHAAAAACCLYKQQVRGPRRAGANGGTRRRGGSRGTYRAPRLEGLRVAGDWNANVGGGGIPVCGAGWGGRWARPLRPRGRPTSSG